MSSGERSADAVVADLCAALAPVWPPESVPLAMADRRVLNEAPAARCDAPAFDSAAMDGYALRASDIGLVTLREIGRALAGHPFDGDVGSGECVRIMTGAPMPRGADTVVMIEDTTVEPGVVRLVRPPRARANVRLRGEHLRAGEPVLAAGTRLGATEIALLASAGVDRIECRRALRVGVLSTGDELADAPAPLAPGATYDANRPLLLRAAADLGFLTSDRGICPDRADAYARALEHALDDGLDALLVSGGAAQGDADIVRRAAAMRFEPVNFRPGRGLAWGLAQGNGRALPLFGLPGNAVAAWTMFHLLARPVLLHLAGARPQPLPWLDAPLAHGHARKGGRIDYLRGRLVMHDGATAVELLREQGSAMLRSVCAADVLVELGPQPEHAAGSRVRVLPLAALRG